MSFKRVPLYYGDTVQLCFVHDKELSQTLSVFDDALVREKSSLFIKTGHKDYPLVLENSFFHQFPVFGDYHIGMLNGNKMVGHFKFESLEETEDNHLSKAERECINDLIDRCHSVVDKDNLKNILRKFS